MWSDGSRFENGRVGIVAVGLIASGIWKSKKSALGDNKKVFDVTDYHYDKRPIWCCSGSIPLINQSKTPFLLTPSMHTASWLVFDRDS